MLYKLVHTGLITPSQIKTATQVAGPSKHYYGRIPIKRRPVMYRVKINETHQKGKKL